MCCRNRLQSGQHHASGVTTAFAAAAAILTRWGHDPRRVGVPVSFGDTDEKTYNIVEMDCCPLPWS